jgi:hypothetical protein
VPLGAASVAVELARAAATSDGAGLAAGLIANAKIRAKALSDAAHDSASKVR